MNRVIYGDALTALRELPDGLAQVCVTSPPYWGLRDYGVEGQLGLETTPEEYVERLVEIMREVRRVLRDDGTLWLNLGDSYAGAGHDGGTNSLETNRREQRMFGGKRPIAGLKPKDLCGMPWRVAFALQADGWWLRSDIIWAKPNPMPESVTDRPTRSHEYLFLLTKRARYYYDADAIREDGPTYTRKAGGYKGRNGKNASRFPGKGGFGDSDVTTTGRNKRSVWQIATKPFRGAHFATFPPALVEPCVLAGSSPQACPECGAPRERVVERPFVGCNYGKRPDNPHLSGSLARPPAGAAYKGKTTGWRATCSCEENDGSGRCVVLDPFAGSGTVGEVALKHGRDYLLIELNRDYEPLIRSRLGLFYKEGEDE